MRIGSQKMIDTFFFFGSHSDHAFAATGLLAEGVWIHAFNVAVGRYHHNRRFIRNQIFGGKFLDAMRYNFGATFLTVFIF